MFKFFFSFSVTGNTGDRNELFDDKFLFCCEMTKMMIILMMVVRGGQ